MIIRKASGRKKKWLFVPERPHLPLPAGWQGHPAGLFTK
jgi:hypothetical protein